MQGNVEMSETTAAAAVESAARVNEFETSVHGI
jgi:hypothetical protein